MKKIATPGLLLYFLIAGWGPFIALGLSSVWVFPWIAGYLLLLLSVSYEFIDSPSPILPIPFRFIALGILFMNFIMQLSGGAHSNLWSAYYIFAVVFAALSRLPQALFMTLIIIAVELTSHLVTGQYDSARWQTYAGFGLSLTAVSAAASFIMGFVLKEAEEAKDARDRLIEKAAAVDPLAAPAKLEMLTQESRQAANLNTAQDLEESLAGMLEMTCRLVPAHTYALFVKERRESGEVYVLRACRTESKGAVVPVGTILFPASGKTRIDLCAERRVAQYIPDIADMPVQSLGYYRSDARNTPVRSAMLIPLLSKDQESVVAVLAGDRLAPDEFDGETQEMLKHFAAFFRHFIEKALMSLDLETKAAIFGGLHDISADLISSLKFSEIMEKVIPRIKQVVPFDLCICLLRTGTDPMLQVQVIALDGYDRSAIGRSFLIEKSPVLAFMHKHWLDRGTATFYTADYGDRSKDIEFFPLKELQRPVRSLFGRLFVANDEFLGAFFLASFQPDAFTLHHRNDLLDTLLNQVALVANNSQLHQQIQNMARTDGLTGLLNHRTFMEMLHAKYRELERMPRPFSILLMDIDKFKGVNDKYGHPVGDVAIKAVARILHETIRGTDFVARYGGEEFAVGMVETDRKGAELMAERVRSIMERTVVTRVFDGDLKCTLSIGVSTFPEDTRDSKDLANLVTYSDEALYHAKRSGRNRVCLYRDAAKASSPSVRSGRPPGRNS